jgi:aryl-alcohol dehydrogenase-like predicted oxidoreductase
METRRFGRSGHLSTVAIFGAAAFYQVEQPVADRAIQTVIDYGVNHIDVAPSYGMAEECLAPWMVKERQRFFLGCKTTERTRDGAASELQRSLQRLRVDHIDLYQIHAVTSMEELDQVTRPGGALEAIVAARQAGLTRFIGITGHGVHSPQVFIEALQRFDFDSVLFPVNFVQFTDVVYRQAAEELLRQCRDRDVGVMAIKSIAQRPWGEQERTNTTWYQPFVDPDVIQTAVNFVLSQAVTGVCTAGDVSLLPLVLQACENFTPLSADEQEALIQSGSQHEPLFSSAI